jgi:two-component system cell cycle sensor histidine kinase/response regulator CckA
VRRESVDRGPATPTGPFGPGDLATLIEDSPDVAVVHDTEALLYANRAAVSLLGSLSQDDVVGRPIAEFLSRESLARLQPLMERVLETGSPAGAEDRLRLPDGQHLDVELRTAPVVWDGRTVLQTAIRDIGRRKRAERELVASQERYRSLFDGVPVGLYRSTPAGRLLDANQALVRMLGYPDRETLLATPVQALYVDPSDRDLWLEKARREIVLSGHEVRLRRYDGRPIYARLSTRLTRDADGGGEHLEGAIEDLTEARRTEERYTLLVETTAQGVVYHDETGAIISANPAAERILGLSESQLLGRTALHPDWRVLRPDGSRWPGEELPAFTALREGRPVRNALMQVFNPLLEEHRWIELDSIPLFHPGAARPHQVYSTFRDVTERRRASEEVLRSEQRLEWALAGSGLGIWDWNVTTGEIYVDHRWYEMLGYEPDEVSLTIEKLFRMVHPDDRHAVQDALQRHLGGSTAHYEVECRLRTRDGKWRWVLDRGQVVERDAEGRALRAAGTHTVIQQRKAAEEALRRSEERLTRIFRAAPLGITLSRVTDGLFLEVNDSFAESLGYDPSELVGRTSTELGIWANLDDRRRAMEELMASGHLRGLSTRFLGRNGVIREVHLFTDLITVDGQPCALTLHRDVTESRRLEEQLRQAQKMEAVGRLAGGIAHDFNNLLTAMTGHVRFLLDALEEDDERRADAEGIEAATVRASRLTRQLLAFSRQQMMRPRVVDLGEVIQSFEPLLRRLIGEDVEFRVDRSAEACFVRVDTGQLEQVLLNLAVNARDALPFGGTLTVETDCASFPPDAPAPVQDIPPGSYARLSVTDDGVGMDETTLARAFEPFFTTKPAGKGTGLGLSTVYGIVNQSGGHLGVTSRVGEGTSFTIYLPVVERPPEDGADAAAADDGEARGTERVLVVEDEDAVRSLSRRVLERAGYDVEDAPYGAAALQLLRDIEPPDLLLTDMVMPGMSGRELADRMREMLPSLRVVFMSGYTTDEVIRDVENPRGNFLEKPFTPAELSAAIRAALDA